MAPPGRDRDGPDSSPAADAGLDGFQSAADVPDFRAARQHVLTELLRFVSELRDEGVDVPATGALDAARALSVVGLGDEQRVAAALRASLIAELDDVDAFEAGFPTFWHRLRSGLDRIATAHEESSDPTDEAEGSTPAADASGEEAAPGVLEDAEPPPMDDAGEGGDVAVRIPTDRSHTAGDRPAESGGSDARRYSAVGESQPIEESVPTSSAEERAAIDRFVDALATLPGRRRRRASSGELTDARAALRASLETGGAPLELPRRERVPSELRCCLLVDVSGSVLDTVDRSALLGLVDGLVEAALRARVFFFDTDVVEVTETVARARGSTAAALREAEVRWGGGTRIGAALDTLRRTAPYAIDRRTVVVVVSDGLDVGDPDLLADGITWLADRAGQVVWLNPLAVSPSFEPTARGMATVEPYLDALFGFARASDLAAAAGQLERRGLGGPVGYEYDTRKADGALDGDDSA
jgi:hypothetical protein